MDTTAFAQVVSPWLGDEPHSVGTQLGLAIRQAITMGLLPPGARLPPERAIAAEFNVSRPTVSATLADLKRRGLLTSRQGSGSWVADGVTEQQRQIPFAQYLESRGLIDLAAATAADASCLPPISIDTNDLLAAQPANGLAPAGLESLRMEAAEREARTGSTATPSHVVMTSGAHQALALLLADLVPTGAVVLVEDVTYGGVLDLIRAHGAVPVGIERDTVGPLPHALRSLIARHSPAMVLLVASVHSPTGRIADDERCHDIAEALAGFDGHVVLDQTYADLEFERTGHTLATLLTDRAIRVSSLSKSLWTGLRTGWITAPPNVCEELVQTRWSRFDLGPPIASQLFAVAALRQLDGILDRRRRQLREQSRAMIDGLAQCCPDWEVVEPDGGNALWVRHPSGDGTVAAAAAAERGVAVLPGSACRTDRGPDPHIRLCFDRPADVITAALERLS